MNTQLNKKSIIANIEYHKSRIEQLEIELAKEKMLLGLEENKLEDYHGWGVEE